LHRSLRIRLANNCRIKRSGEVDNLSESDGSDSECTQDSNRESSGEFVAINTSTLTGLKHAWKHCTPPCFSSPKLYYLPPALPCILRLVHMVGTHSSKIWPYTRKWVKSVARCSFACRYSFV